MEKKSYSKEGSLLRTQPSLVNTKTNQPLCEEETFILPSDPSDILTAWQVAELMKISHRTVAKWRLEGIITDFYELSPRLFVYSKKGIMKLLAKKFRHQTENI